MLFQMVWFHFKSKKYHNTSLLKISSLVGLATIFSIGLSPFVMGEYNENELQYLQLKEIYDEQRWKLEKEFKEKFTESSNYFNEQKQAIYEKSAADPTLSSEKINQMLRNAFYEFVERQDDIKTEYISRVDSLDAMFAVKFEQYDTTPPWIKKVIELWHDGKISNNEIENCLAFLINKGIIKAEQISFTKYSYYK